MTTIPLPPPPSCTAGGRRRPRAGFALLDVMIGGVMLGVSLAVVLSLTGRSLAMQGTGERQLVASWLADELLSLVLVEGPDEFARVHDTTGRFDAPFEDYEFEISIKSLGRGLPYTTVAAVRWGDRPGDYIEIETVIARQVRRPDSEEFPREPLEPVDRDARYHPEEADP